MIQRMAAAWAVALIWVLVSTANAEPPITFPIYIEDNHAGSAYWLAQHINLDEECTLLHFDAHSDATAIFDSDELRIQIRRVPSLAEREKRLAEWRPAGVFQCFNWIEPLTPSPFSQVIWIPRETLDVPEAVRMEAEAVEALDGHLEAAPRRNGSFQGRYHVVGLKDLSKKFQEGNPVVVTIDLDYFAGMEPTAQAAAFERVWSFVVGLRNLRAVTVGISRPFLTGDAESHRLLRLALEGAFSLPTAVVNFEPLAAVGNDHSLLAESLRRQGKAIPFYDISAAPEELKAVVLANRARINIEREPKRWNALLAHWEAEAPHFSLGVCDHAPSTDGIWRLPVSENAEVELHVEHWDATASKVEWIALSPVFPSCNLTAQRATDGVFATGAPPRPRWKETVLSYKGNVLEADTLKPFFDPAIGCGSVRLKARVQGRGWVRETPVMELRRFAGTGFRASITEQFGLPYLFGSGLLQTDDATGPETGWGADCANLLVYSLRRQGRCVPWSDPKQLRTYLEPVSIPAVPGKTTFTAEDVENGLIVHFGTHVAVLMEDRQPLGVLDNGDLVAHQLEGLPEIVPLGKLLETRKDRPFDLLRVFRPQPEARLLIGGDVMLARTVGEQIKAGVDPFAGIRSLWDNAALRIVNLECVISNKGTPLPGKPYIFRAPVEAAHALRSAKVNAVGLANNHTGDCGSTALQDCVVRLKNERLVPIGSGPGSGLALAPALFSLPNGQRVAVFAVNALDNRASREDLAKAIRQAHVKADWVLCLVHWGDENTPLINDDQRRLARWLIDNGIDIIAGSHPHCVQALDSYRGHPIAYSLGNLVFDGARGVPSWNSGDLLEIGISKKQPFFSVRLTSVRLDEHGFPRFP